MTAFKKSGKLWSQRGRAISQLNKVAVVFACRMGPGRNKEAVLCDRERKHFNGQPGHPSLPSPSSSCEVYTIFCPPFQNQSTGNQLFLALPQSWGCLKEN